MMWKPFSKDKKEAEYEDQEDSKQNPASLRTVFRYIREMNDSSPEAFEKKLLPYCVRYGKKKMPAKTIRQIENDHTRIQYWHIELYSNYIGIPSGALLLFSRLKADERDKKQEDFVKTRESIKEIFSNDDLFDEFDPENLIKWIDVFTRKEGKLL